MLNYTQYHIAKQGIVMEKYIIAGLLAGGMLFFALLAIFVCRVNSERLASAEMLLRNRILGAVLSAAALAWCVPQIQAVAWSWLAQYAWFIAAGAWFLCVKYLDNMVARGFAGLLIMGAYSFLDMSFDCKLNMGIAGALVAWVCGGVGIAIAAKPCYLRDYLRLGSEKRFWRYLASLLAIITVPLLAAALVIFWKVQG